MKISLSIMFLPLVLTAFSLHCANGSDLTVVDPPPKRVMHLGDTLTIRATGDALREIEKELAKGAAHHKLELHLANVSLPGLLFSHYRGPALGAAALDEMNKSLQALKKEIADKPTPDAEARIKALENEIQQGGEHVVYLNFVVDRYPQQDESRKAWDTILASMEGYQNAIPVSLGVGEMSPQLVDGGDDQHGQKLLGLLR